MATRFIAVDSGAASRLIRRFFAVDSGNVARAIKRAFVIDSGGTARLFFASSFSLSATMVQGDDGLAHFGYQSGVVGSLTPNTPSPTGTVTSIAYDYAGSNVSFIEISGLASNPGQASINSVTVNSISNTPGDGAWNSYSYSAGVATWIWNGNIWSLNGSSSVGVTIA